MQKTIDTDLLLNSDFQRLSVGTKSLYVTLFCSADKYGIVENVYRILGINSYVSSNLDDLVKAGYVIMLRNDSALIADYFLHMANSVVLLNDERLDDYQDTTVINRRFVKTSDVNKGNRKRAAFTPPTLEEVRAYAKERNSTVDPVAFFTYYNTPNENGETWVNSLGKPVVNWKNTFVSVWERNRKLKGAANERGNRQYSQSSAERNTGRVSQRYNIVPAVNGRAKG